MANDRNGIEHEPFIERTPAAPPEQQLTPWYLMDINDIKTLSLRDTQTEAENLAPKEYQQECLDTLKQMRSGGEKNALVQMATGLGKTYLAAFDAKEFLTTKPEARILFLAHQNDILDQSEQNFRKVLGEECSYGQFHGEVKDFEAVNCLFASFQTMRTWKDAFLPTDFDYIVVDESHHVSADTYQPVVDYFEPEFMLGITATPDRHDGRDIRDVFGEEKFKLALEEALARGLLANVDYRLMTDDIEFRDDILGNGKKLSLAELNKKLFIPKRDEEIVQIINDHTEDPSSVRRVVFCPSIEYAEHMSSLMEDTVPLHSQIPKYMQDKIIAAFRAGLIKTVLTVDMFNEGIDIPEANQIVFLRSTQSKTVFLQQLGRGLRKTEDKEQVMVLDFVVNCERITMVNELWEHVKSEATELIAGNPDYLVTNVGQFEFTQSAKDIVELLRKIGEGYTEAELITMLKGLGDELGAIPAKDIAHQAWKDGKIVHPQVFCSTFGSWRRALRAAGYEVRVHPSNYDPDEAIAMLKEFFQSIDHIPSENEILQAGRDGVIPHKNTYANIFGSWNQALLAAGIDIKIQKFIDPKQMLDELRMLTTQLGRSPTKEDWELARRQGIITVGISPVVRHFGGWNQALEAAGLKINLQYIRRDYSDEELITIMRELAEKVNGPLTIPKIRKLRSQNPDSVPSVSTISHHFGSWNDALVASGLEVGRNRITYDDDVELLDQIVRLAAHLGRLPVVADLNNSGDVPFNLASKETFKQRFGSWNGALKASGLLDDEESGLGAPSRKGQRYEDDELLQQLKTLRSELGKVPSGRDIERAAVLGKIAGRKTFVSRFGSVLGALSLLDND